MSTIYGSNVTTGGLVTSIDMNNTKKSWKGMPTTNLAKTSGGADDFVVSNLDQSVTTSYVNGRLRITSTSNTGQAFRFNFDHTKMTNAATYTMSFRYQIISSTDSTPYFQAKDWCDQSITRNVVNEGNGIFYETASGSRATYDETFDFMDFIISDNTTVEIWDIQLEQNDFATPYTDYQRTSTEALTDISKSSKIVTVSDLLYNSDGTFEFDGVNDYYTINDFLYPATWEDSFSIEAMVYIPTGADWHDTTTANGGTAIVGRGAYNGSIGLLRTDTTQLKFWIRPNSLGYTVSYSASYDTWYHLVGAYDGVTGTMRLYVNGVDQGSTVIVKELTPDVGNWIVGGVTAFSGDTGRYGKGKIPVTRLYNRNLTATEVKTNFNAIRSRYGI